MPVSLNIVQVHTKEKRDGLPVTVHVRRDKPNQWQWQFETTQGKSKWHSGDLEELKNYWRVFSLM
jgi:hypothetical protein